MPTLTVQAPGTLIVPIGSQVTDAYSVTDTAVALDVDVADYDYEPFADPRAPEFEFVADIIRIHADHTTNTDRAVPCISSPGRHSREKDN